MSKIINLSGISGSGKSTYAASLEKEGLIIVNADKIRGELSGGNESDQSRNGYIFQFVIPNRVRKAILEGKDVVIDVTSPDRKSRKLALELGNELGVDVECHYFEPNVERAKQWNKQRSRQVPDEVIDRQAAKWQTPNKDEGFSLVAKVM